MNFKIFTVYDCKAQNYLQPFFCRSTGEAVRSFTEIANDPKSQIGKYPVDFTLFELGSFDDNTADFVIFNTPVSLGLANDFVELHPVRMKEEQLDLVK